MIITITKDIPQTPLVQSMSLRTMQTVMAAVPMASEVNLVGIPGPQGIQGEPGTIVHVGPTAPENPNVNDLWVDTA